MRQLSCTYVTVLSVDRRMTSLSAEAAEAYAAEWRATFSIAVAVSRM